MTTTLRLADWTTAPGGRFGPFSGDEYRERVILTAMKNGGVVIVLDGVYGISHGFMEEAFGGTVRAIRKRPDEFAGRCEIRVVCSEDPETEEEAQICIMDEILRMGAESGGNP